MSDEDMKKKVKRTVTPRKKTEKPSIKNNNPETTADATNLSIDDTMLGKPCPICGKGTIIKGNTAYGCSHWKEGCTFRRPFNKP